MLTELICSTDGFLHLHGAECVEQVGVVSDAGADASTLVLTGLDEVCDLLLVHARQLTHQVHHRQTPVDPAHPQVLRQRVLLDEGEAELYELSI